MGSANYVTRNQAIELNSHYIVDCDSLIDIIQDQNPRAALLRSRRCFSL